MNNTTLIKTIILFFTLIGTLSANAQDTAAVQKFPTVLLVQLRAEQNRIEALTKAKEHKLLAEVKEDAIGVDSAIIRDFRDHFDYCPVYFYMDTNLDLVKQRKFDGVLFNADGTLATNTGLSDTSKMYLIVFYGFPVAQTRIEGIAKDSTNQHVDSGEPMGRGLIINNYKFQQISFLYKFDYDNLGYRIKYAKKYIYKSKHFDMEYFPFANELSAKLKKRDDRIRITHINHITSLLFDQD